MTLEERLAIIENKAIKNKTIEDEKKKNLQEKTDEALKKIQELAPRIDALLTVANKCIEQGIVLPSPQIATKFGYGNNTYSFCADGIYHHLGFMDCKIYWCSAGKIPYQKTNYLGFDMGGFCGVWDFYTNGITTFLKHESDGTRKNAELSYMESFLKEFPLFETAFYNWVDSLAD